MTTIINSLLAIPGVGLSLLGCGALALLLSLMHGVRSFLSDMAARPPAPRLLLPPPDKENAAA